MADVVFDEGAVLAELRRAARDAWQRLQAPIPTEQVYGLLLYHGIEYGYVCASGFTEEGLDRVTEEYRQGRWGADYEGADGREKLRWSTQDSPYHVLAEVGAPPLLSSEQLDDDDAPWADDDDAWDHYAHAIRSLCERALRELDDEGLFAEGRERLTLTIEDRDGSETLDEIRRIVAALNPPEVAARYDAYLRDICGHTL